MGDVWGLAGGFGDDAISGHQGGRDLAGEDSEWEIPWGDADECAAASECDLVVFACRTGEDLGDEISAASVCVVAEEVDGFADFVERVGDGFPGLMNGDVHEGLGVFFEQIGDFIEDVGALGGGGLHPFGEGFFGGLEERVDVGFGGFF